MHAEGCIDLRTTPAYRPMYTAQLSTVLPTLLTMNEAQLQIEYYYGNQRFRIFIRTYVKYTKYLWGVYSSFT